MTIEHDPMGQKFATVSDSGEESFLAYTMINDCLNLHVMFAPDDNVAEELATAAFEHAKQNGLKIISSSEFIDDFVRRNREYEELLETDQ